ncbi:hypothetical protein BH20GEM1_BH20GEM1_01390 [soil metagenome]
MRRRSMSGPLPQTIRGAFPAQGRKRRLPTPPPEGARAMRSRSHAHDATASRSWSGLPAIAGAKRRGARSMPEGDRGPLPQAWAAPRFRKCRAEDPSHISLHGHEPGRDRCADGRPRRVTPQRPPFPDARFPPCGLWPPRSTSQDRQRLRRLSGGSAPGVSRSRWPGSCDRGEPRQHRKAPPAMIPRLRRQGAELPRPGRSASPGSLAAQPRRSKRHWPDPGETEKRLTSRVWRSCHHPSRRRPRGRPVARTALTRSPVSHRSRRYLFDLFQTLTDSLGDGDARGAE